MDDGVGRYGATIEHYVVKCTGKSTLWPDNITTAIAEHEWIAYCWECDCRFGI